MDDLEITPAEVKQRLDRGEKLVLIDVREPWEFSLCRIEGAKLIPMGTVPANLQALDTDDEIVVYCHHGVRSLDVTVWLRGQGVEGAKSLAGGIERGVSVTAETSFPEATRRLWLTGIGRAREPGRSRPRSGALGGRVDGR